MSAWTIKVDNLLEEIKYAAHAGDLQRARTLAVELHALLSAHVEESVS